ncbi:MAG: hypothetical protein LBC53_02715 [Spirochaetaceae bacterium]|nr:hypothetical protein [Spirochaetaceae bacterium]
MAVATVNLSFDDDMMRQIDYFANNESLTPKDLIYNSVKMYINRKKRLDLFANLVGCRPSLAKCYAFYVFKRKLAESSPVKLNQAQA